jgi:phenylpropionate dioxygenase-like ring-hydroxylating dioxygenase large terminal subunit
MPANKPALVQPFPTEARSPRRTRFDDMINVETREVSVAVFSDRELYDLEMERIFSKTWQIVGHESEIPKPGDFITRHMGEDSVIVARGRDGEVHVSLNVCPHRAMKVCLQDRGNSFAHRCVYHGWVFSPTGDFIGSPVEREKMHGEIYGKDQLGLRKAKVHLYGGIIFSTWAEDGPTFDEYMGEAKFYFDMLLCRTDAGLEVLGPPQRILIPANWKTASEQSACDGFHTLTLHRSLMEIGQMGGGGDSIYDQAPAMYGIDISCKEGHSLRCIPAEQTFSMIMGSGIEKLSPDERLKVLPPPGISQELLPQLYKHLSPDQMKLMASAPPQVGGLFPNAGFLFIYAPAADGTMVGALAFHAFIPRGPEHFEFWTWLFAEKDASPEMKKAMRAAGIQAVGTSGTIEQDDADTWPHMSESARGVMGKQETLKYQALLGEKKPEGWVGGGYVYEGFTKDDTQWNWWLAYRDLMSGEVGA